MKTIMKNRKRTFTSINPKDYEGNDNSRREQTHRAAFTEAKLHDRFEESGRRYIKTAAFTLVELIVAMAVIGILVLLAAPKFLGYTQRAQETKHIHTAKVIETALEAYLIHGGEFPTDLEVVDETLLSDSVAGKTLIGVDGYVSTLDGDTYYELTYDFIRKLDVKLSASSTIFIEAMASTAPTALYASEKGITLVDKDKTLKGYTLQPGELPNEVSPDSVINLSTSGNHSLLIKDDGTVWAWGENNFGQLGLGNYLNQTVPQEITFLKDKNIQSVVAGSSHSLALSDNGKVWAWGFNTYGQLGVGNKINQSTPIEVTFLNDKDIKSIHAGMYHSLAVGHDGTIWTWGMNGFGDLGLGTTTATFTTPQKHVFFQDKNIQTVKVNGRNNVAIDNAGKIWIWGVNAYGGLGLGHTNTVYVPNELTLPEGAEIKSIILGNNSIFAISSDDSVWAWGDNAQGKLGLGDIVNKSRPMKVMALDGKNIQSIASSVNYTLALSTDGSVWAWGYNYWGQLGLGHTATSTPALPNEIEFLRDKKIKEILVGSSHSIALSSTNKLWAWGNNEHGQLGDGTITNRLTPTLITID